MKFPGRHAEGVTGGATSLSAKGCSGVLAEEDLGGRGTGRRVRSALPDLQGDQHPWGAGQQRGRRSLGQDLQMDA